jgi:hypothetical protein
MSKKFRGVSMSKILKEITSQDIAASVLLKANMPAPLMTTEELQYSVNEDKFKFILVDDEQDDKLETAHQLLQEEQLDETVLSLEYDMIPSDIVLVSNETDSKKTVNIDLTEVDDNASLWWILAGVSSAVIFNGSDSTVPTPIASEPETVGIALPDIDDASVLSLPEELSQTAFAADVDNDGLVDGFAIDVTGAIAELLFLDDPNGGEFNLADFSPDEFVATLFHNGRESSISLVKVSEGFLAGMVDDGDFSYDYYDPTDYIQLIGNGFTYNYSIPLIG